MGAADNFSTHDGASIDAEDSPYRDDRGRCRVQWVRRHWTKRTTLQPPPPRHSTTTTNGSSARATMGNRCWRVEGPEDARAIPSADMDDVIKRVEGSTNREEEILFVDRSSNAASLDAVRNASASLEREISISRKRDPPSSGTASRGTPPGRERGRKRPMRKRPRRCNDEERRVA